jgi:hypothetical protein
MPILNSPDAIDVVHATSIFTYRASVIFLLLSTPVSRGDTLLLVDGWGPQFMQLKVTMMMPHPKWIYFNLVTGRYRCCGSKVLHLRT